MMRDPHELDGHVARDLPRSRTKPDVIFQPSAVPADRDVPLTKPQARVQGATHPALDTHAYASYSSRRLGRLARGAVRVHDAPAAEALLDHAGELGDVVILGLAVGELRVRARE